jgi:hypothetical protein
MAGVEAVIFAPHDRQKAQPGLTLALHEGHE